MLLINGCNLCCLSFLYVEENMIYFQVSFNIKSRNQKKKGGARKTKAAGACLSSKWYIQINIYLFTTIIETDNIMC